MKRADVFWIIETEGFMAKVHCDVTSRALQVNRYWRETLHLSRVDFEGEAIEDWDFWPGWIREGNTVQLHPASKVSRL
jgi:hypothetical protein